LEAFSRQSKVQVHLPYYVLLHVRASCLLTPSLPSSPPLHADLYGLEPFPVTSWAREIDGDHDDPFFLPLFFVYIYLLPMFRRERKLGETDNSLHPF
jgi:hypothetical protein